MKKDIETLKSELTKAGAKFKGNSCSCPFCDDAHPSAGVFITNGDAKFKCHKCGFYGDIYDVVAKRDNVSLTEVLKALSNHDKPLSKPHSEQTPLTYTKVALWNKIKSYGVLEAIYKYTDDRGILSFQVARIKQADGCKTFRPVRQLSEDKYSMELPPAPRYLYNLPAINDKMTVIVVEGEKCVDALSNLGIAATCSVAGAKAAKHTDWTALQGKSIIIWRDNDPAGLDYQKAVIAQTEGIVANYSIIDVETLGLDSGGDVADFIAQRRHLTPEQIKVDAQAVLDGAVINDPASELLDRIDKIVSGELAPIETSWTNLDRLTHWLMPQTVSLLIGAKGSCKTWMVFQLLAHCINNGVKVACLELEDSRAIHLNRVIAQIAYDPRFADTDEIKKPHIAAEIKKTVVEHRQLVNKIGHSLDVASDDLITQDQLIKWAETKAKQGNQLIIIDPISIAETNKDVWVADKQFVKGIKRVAEDYNTAMLLVNHPTKQFAQPDEAFIAGSAAYARFAHSIVWIEKHRYKNSIVQTPCGNPPMQHNQTMTIIKARNGKGQGLQLAFDFSDDGLTSKELGIYVGAAKKTKKDPDGIIDEILTNDTNFDDIPI